MRTSVLHIKTEVDCKVFLFDEEKGIATSGKYFNLEVRKGEQDLLLISIDDEYCQYHFLYTVEEFDNDYTIVIEKNNFNFIHERITSMASDEEIAHGFADEFGVVYSLDGLHLLESRGHMKLGHYQVRKGCQVIRDMAFALSSISSITFPDTITHIGSHAFSVCKNLTSITIPSSVVHIGSGAFFLTKIKTVTCETSNFSYENGCLIDIKQKKVISFLSSEHNVIIPRYIHSIGAEAFSNIAISTISLNNGLKSIEKSAFLGCKIREITFPYSLEEIGYSAFSATNLIKITNLSPNIIFDKGFLIVKKTQTLIACFSNDKEIELPKAITHIGSNLFAKNGRIDNKFNKYTETIIVPEGVTTIEDYAFSGCAELTTIILPETLAHIGTNAFYLCFKLKNIKLPLSLKHVGEGALSSLTIHIPLGTRAYFESLLNKHNYDYLIEETE